jgi:protein-L-isoaspartate(D-aspartate) O-methyltransferase
MMLPSAFPNAGLAGAGERTPVPILVLMAIAALFPVPLFTAEPAGTEHPEGRQKEAPAEGVAAKPPKRPPPPAAAEFAAEREAMVKAQMARPRDGRDPIKAAEVLEAMRAVPRQAFVPPSVRPRAYADSALPIGHGQTISQPYIVALMTELLGVSPGSKVLEIGTGSGYQAAVLAEMGVKVYTIEIIAALAEGAEKALREQGYTDVRCRRADGYHGWPEEAPFDAIIVTCAAGHLPPPLWDQLRPGGRIVIPIGSSYEVQRLVVVTKTEDGKRRSRTVTGVAFVPMTRSRERDR